MSQIMYTYPSMLAHAGEMHGYVGLRRSAQESPPSSPLWPPPARVTREVDGVFVGGRRGDDDADRRELLHIEEIRRPQMLITSADSGVQ